MIFCYDDEMAGWFCLIGAWLLLEEIITDVVSLYIRFAADLISITQMQEHALNKNTQHVYVVWKTNTNCIIIRLCVLYIMIDISFSYISIEIMKWLHI